MKANKIYKWAKDLSAPLILLSTFMYGMYIACSPFYGVDIPKFNELERELNKEVKVRDMSQDLVYRVQELKAEEEKVLASIYKEADKTENRVKDYLGGFLAIYSFLGMGICALKTWDSK